MVILNGRDELQELDTQRFSEFLESYQTGTDIITGDTFDINISVDLQPMQALILELK